MQQKQPALALHFEEYSAVRNRELGASGMRCGFQARRSIFRTSGPCSTRRITASPVVSPIDKMILRPFRLQMIFGPPSNCSIHGFDVGIGIVDADPRIIRRGWRDQLFRLSIFIGDSMLHDNSQLEDSTVQDSQANDMFRALRPGVSVHR